MALGSGVTSIGSDAFCSNYELKEIHCNALTPPAADEYTFESVMPSNVLLVVPEAPLVQYRAHGIRMQFRIEPPLVWQAKIFFLHATIASEAF